MRFTSDYLRTVLPVQSAKNYAAVGRCIYCGNVGSLGDEHIIPLGLGGKMIIPKSSCKACSGISSAFEGVCLRTMLGPLRMFYDLPSRRKNDRPEKLPLKIKYNLGDEWTKILVDREEYPFLILFPHFELPELLSGNTSVNPREKPSAKKFWIRGASTNENFKAHLEFLCAKLRVRMIEPEATVSVPEFGLMLAKIAHSYATAELGCDKFEPLLLNFILRKDLSNSMSFLGGLNAAEPPSEKLHEVSFCETMFGRPDLVVVRIRLLAKLGTPTYYIVAGRRLA